LTPSDIAQIEARLKAATPGPYRAGTIAMCADIAALLEEVKRLRKMGET
jgi:hypothetical protein